MNEFPTRAFFAFSVALAASAWALFAEIGKPYLPSIPIVVYTLYLYVNRSAVGQQDSDALKDSPYFLGFLLTMFGLFKIFNDFSSNSALFGANPDLMTSEIGAAVLTTIVGLFSRQALLGLVKDEAPAEDDRMTAVANAVTSHAVAFEMARQQFFREMADERVKHSKELERTQERVLARLDDLTRNMPIIGGPTAHAEAGYSLAERPGAIVVGATPRPTVGFAAGVPSAVQATEHHAEPTGFVDAALPIGEPFPIAMGDLPFGKTTISSERDISAATTAIAPPPATPIEVAPVEVAVPRPFEPIAALVTPPPSSGKTAEEWIVATSRPVSLSPEPARPDAWSHTPTPAPAPSPAFRASFQRPVEDFRSDRPSRTNSAIAAPYVRPTRSTGYGDVS